MVHKYLLGNELSKLYILLAHPKIPWRTDKEQNLIKSANNSFISVKTTKAEKTNFHREVFMNLIV